MSDFSYKSNDLSAVTKLTLSKKTSNEFQFSSSQDVKLKPTKNCQISYRELLKFRSYSRKKKLSRGAFSLRSASVQPYIGYISVDETDFIVSSSPPPKKLLRSKAKPGDAVVCAVQPTECHLGGELKALYFDGRHEQMRRS